MKTKITKDEINQLPLARYSRERATVCDKDTCDQVVKRLSQESVLGFDTETRPVHKKGDHHDICMIQLATEEIAFIFRINQFGFCQSLIDLLENEDISKVGIAVSDDLKGLQKLSPFKPGGFIELAKMAKALKLENFGLRSLTALLLNQRISKRHKMTNWELPILSDDQLDYAAMDAWLGLKLYQFMRELMVKQNIAIDKFQFQVNRDA